MDDYIWLTERARRSEAAWAITGSLLTHALMLFVLTFTDVTLPLTGMAGKKLDVIWLSPLSFTDLPPEHPGLPEAERQARPRHVTKVRESAGQVRELPEVATVSTSIDASPPVRHTMALPAEVLPAKTYPLEPSPPASPADAADAENPGESVVKGVSMVADERKVVPAVEQREDMAAVERRGTNGHASKEVLAKATQPEPAARQGENLQLSSAPARSEVKTGEATPSWLSMQKPLPNLLPTAAVPPETVSTGDKTAAAVEKPGIVHPAPPATTAAESFMEKHGIVHSAPPATRVADSANSPALAGIVYPAVNGDLKLVVKANSEVRVLVSFRELPMSKRNAPQTRAQAGVPKQVVPIFYKTREGAAEAVIKTAQEGVYTFRVEGVTPGASVTLKLFEGSAKEKAALQPGSERQLLVRVLMPEGILWNDATAFSGSLEDSNSITKFNTQTGLYWREYHH